MKKIRNLMGFIGAKVLDYKTFFNKQNPSIFNWYLFNIFIGVLLSEIFYFGTAVGNALFAWAIIEHVEIDLIEVFIIFMTIIVISFIYYRLQLRTFNFYWKNISFYLPKILFHLLGIGISVAANGIFHEEYEQLIAKVYLESIALIVAFPFLYFFVFSTLAFTKLFRKESSNKPFFLSDAPIVDLKDDLLEVNNNAEKFANLVLNNNSSESLIFGIDAPWGIGKTSFINRCNKAWNKLDEVSRPVVILFDPIKYLSQDNLSEKLVNEISQGLNNYSPNTTLDSSFEAYINILKENNHINLFGMSFKIPTNNNFEAVFGKLQNEINNLGKKIIIVIDDLDRLSWNESKKILYGIKQSLNLKNVTFVLCYDTNNLELNSQLKNPHIDVVEFLEKYVSVKYTLFVDSAKLAKLVGEDLDKLLKKIQFSSAAYYSQVEHIMNGLKQIYEVENYHKYANILGDLRKVKRLINSILMLNLPSLDLKYGDIDGSDFVKLMMLYIGFPRTFRRIYDSEMNGRSRSFSLNYNKNYENGDFLREGTENKNLTETEEILLKSLFDVETLKNENHCEINDLNKSNRACFNGVNGTSRNLERYLDVIVNLKKLSKLEYVEFYDKKKYSFIKGSESLSTIIYEQDFADEDAKIKLLNAIGNKAELLDSKKALQVFDYIIEEVNKFSIINEVFLETDNRSSLIYILLKVLDRGIWRLDGIYDNSNQNLKIITDLIFGEGNFHEKSIIKKLTNDSRLPLGFYDLLLFRLYCSANRANGLFNIQRALSIRYSESAPTQGPVDDIAVVGMRQISQAVFQRFKEAYIDTQSNFYSEVLNLSADELNGKKSFFPKNTIENTLEKTKSTVLAFVIYQLANKQIQGGVGCGHYDPMGDNDNNQIAICMNKYLFNVCFNPTKDMNNIKNFIHYLLNHLSTPFDIGGRTLEPSMDEITRVLDKNMLVNFWRDNRDSITKAKFDKQDTTFHNVNYSVHYNEYLPKIYKMLDNELITQ